MAVDLSGVGGDSLLSYQSLTDDDDYEILHSHNSPSILGHNEKHVNKDEDDFIVDLTSNMDAYCMFESEDCSSSSTVSDKSEMSWPSWGFADSPEYKLWSPLSSKQSSEVSSPTDNKDPFRYGSSLDPSYNQLNMKFEKFNMDEEWDSEINKGHGCHRLDNPTVVPSSNGSALVDDPVQAVQVWTKRESKGQFLQHCETNKRNIQHYQSQKIAKANGYGNNRQRGRPTGGVVCSGVGAVAGRQQRQQPHKYQQTGSDVKAVFLGGSNARSGACGTGVFLPRTTATSSELRKKAGCSTVLIPARVVQALQQHFDQIGVPSETKAGSFPPLHDVLVDNRDGMYSLQKRNLRRVQNHSHKETSLPQEWTY